MKYIKLLFIFSLTVLIASGCSGDGPTNSDKETQTIPTAESFNNLRESARSSRIQTAQFKAEDGLSFISDKGVTVDIPANCLSENGSAASGEVELEYMEIFEKTDMLVTNRPTMGITASGDKKMLISGGVFSVNVSQDDKNLELSCTGSKLKVPASITGGVKEEMKKWEGIIDSSGDLSWKKKDNGGTNSVVRRDSIGVPNDNYTMLMDDFGWLNCDYFYKDPRTKTAIKITPPQDYDSDNSAAYISFDGVPNSLLHLNAFKDGSFVDNSQQIPIGVEMHVIFITEENGQWRYAIKSVTVAKNDQYNFTLSETTIGSEQELTSAIDALP